MTTNSESKYYDSRDEVGCDSDAYALKYYSLYCNFHANTLDTETTTSLRDRGTTLGSTFKEYLIHLHTHHPQQLLAMQHEHDALLMQQQHDAPALIATN
tara:strand:+ start:30 stop:326 length:297 start_codon:yes stop_codon:yes gene_type:complete